MQVTLNDHPYTKWVNLADPRLGAEAIYATDDFFADKNRMLKAEPAVFIEGKYDENGKWMDGWESRRKRGEGYDYCIVRLGRAGRIQGVDLDTSHFTGNYAPAASLEGCLLESGDPDENTQWTEILPAVTLQGDSHHYRDIASEGVYSHLRVNIYPDGGLARLRVYGTPQCDWESRDPNEVIDLLALENGGRAITCNDQHFGTILNLNMPGRGVNMGDGWETRRRREPGNDWAILALGHAGTIESIEIDTAHFKGNFPDQCSIQAAFVDGGTDESLVTQSMFWQELLPPQKMQMDAIHNFAAELNNIGPITHIRLNIIPDGGVSRLRLFGRIATGGGSDNQPILV
ncbi:MAG: allantoicase [Thiolinea sp.]